jgi:hypothetical protein
MPKPVLLCLPALVVAGMAISSNTDTKITVYLGRPGIELYYEDSTAGTTDDSGEVSFVIAVETGQVINVSGWSKSYILPTVNLTVYRAGIDEYFDLSEKLQINPIEPPISNTIADSANDHVIDPDATIAETPVADAFPRPTPSVGSGSARYPTIAQSDEEYLYSALDEIEVLVRGRKCIEAISGLSQLQDTMDIVIDSKLYDIAVIDTYLRCSYLEGRKDWAESGIALYRECTFRSFFCDPTNASLLASAFRLAGDYDNGLLSFSELHSACGSSSVPLEWIAYFSLAKGSYEDWNRIRSQSPEGGFSDFFDLWVIEESNQCSSQSDIDMIISIFSENVLCGSQIRSLPVGFCKEIIARHIHRCSKTQIHRKKASEIFVSIDEDQYPLSLYGRKIYANNEYLLERFSSSEGIYREIIEDSEEGVEAVVHHRYADSLLFADSMNRDIAMTHYLRASELLERNSVNYAIVINNYAYLLATNTADNNSLAAFNSAKTLLASAASSIPSGESSIANQLIMYNLLKVNMMIVLSDDTLTNLEKLVQVKALNQKIDMTYADIDAAISRSASDRYLQVDDFYISFFSFKITDDLLLSLEENED